MHLSGTTGCMTSYWENQLDRLISWPVSRLFSRVVKYAERDNPLTATKNGTHANIWNRIKNDTFLMFIVDIHVLKIRESEIKMGKSNEK